MDELAIEEDNEMCGIKLKVPRINLQNIKAIEDFIKLESP